jgi:hypothetical protein
MAILRAWAAAQKPSAPACLLLAAAAISSLMDMSSAPPLAYVYVIHIQYAVRRWWR